MKSKDAALLEEAYTTILESQIVNECAYHIANTKIEDLLESASPVVVNELFGGLKAVGSALGQSIKSGAQAVGNVVKSGVNAVQNVASNVKANYQAGEVVNNVKKGMQKMDQFAKDVTKSLTDISSLLGVDIEQISKSTIAQLLQKQLVGNDGKVTTLGDLLSQAEGAAKTQKEKGLFSKAATQATATPAATPAAAPAATPATPAA